jgi:signal transduction histidine kinase
MALGLRLARSVIELHRGDVRVVDRGPKGAMFCITLGTVEPASRRGSPG